MKIFELINIQIYILKLWFLEEKILIKLKILKFKNYFNWIKIFELINIQIYLFKLGFLRGKYLLNWRF